MTDTRTPEQINETYEFNMALGDLVERFHELHLSAKAKGGATDGEADQMAAIMAEMRDLVLARIDAMANYPDDMVKDLRFLVELRLWLEGRAPLPPSLFVA